MNPSEFRILVVGKKGFYERDIMRDDSIISHRITTSIILSNPRFGDTYVEVILWDYDKRIDIHLADKNNNPIVEPLKKIKFHSKKYKNDPEFNIIKLQFINKIGERASHTIETLQKSIARNVVEYFNEKHIKLLKQQLPGPETALFAQHRYSSEYDLAEIYLVAVFIPFITSRSSENEYLNEQKNRFHAVSSFDSFTQKFISFIVVTVLFVGCFTLANRKRIGATCRDGTSSYSTGSGTCSHHGGVRNWTYKYWWDK